MKPLTIDDIRPFLLFECVSGSRAYGLATETSDTDLKGVFYLPKPLFYAGDYVAQVSNDSNDEVYYELGRFIELLCASNPNIVELLNSPEKMVLLRHPLMAKIQPKDFLSQACMQTFANYALGQIKKATGLNKKTMNPVAETRKTVLDFCYVLIDGQSVPLLDWLTHKGWDQSFVGLAKVAHARDVYALYYDEAHEGLYQGVLKKVQANSVLTSHIDASAQLQAYLSFNQDGYSSYCKEYQAYWSWVAQRNEARHQLNQAHGQRYDGKNMMHTFRLLYMALDIAQKGLVCVWRENRAELLAIKQGVYEYAELMLKAEALMQQVEQAFLAARLPVAVDQEKARALLLELRLQLYSAA